MVINDYNQLLKLANRYLIDNKDTMKDYVDQLSPEGDARYDRVANALAEHERESLGAVKDEDRKVFDCYTEMCDQYIDDMSEAQALYAFHALALDLKNKKIDGQTITISKGLIETLNQVKAEYRQKYEEAAERAGVSMAVLNSVAGRKRFSAGVERVAALSADTGANDISAAQQYVLDEAYNRLSKADPTADNSAYRSAQYYDKFGGGEVSDKGTIHIDMTKTDNLTIDNMDAKLNLGATGEYNLRQWAMDAVEDMFIGVYGENKYRELAQNDADRIRLLDSVFVDGVSVGEKYFSSKDLTYDLRCFALMDKLLDTGVSKMGKRLNVQILERNDNDMLVPAADEKIASIDIKANVRAAEPEKAAEKPRLGVWDRIVRFVKNLFGSKEMNAASLNSQIAEKSRAQTINEQISFAAMSNEEAIEKIRSAAEKSRYADTFNSIKQAQESEKKRWFEMKREPFDSLDPSKKVTNSLMDKELSCSYEFVESSEEYPDGIKRGQPLLGDINRMDTQLALAIAVGLVTPGEGELEFSDVTAPVSIGGLPPIVKFAVHRAAVELNEMLAPPTLRSIAGEDLTDEQLAEKFKDPEMQEEYNTALLRSKYRAETLLYKVDEGLKKMGKEIRDLDLDPTDIEELKASSKKIILFDKMVTTIQNTLNGGLAKEDPVFDNVKEQLQSTIDKYYDKDMVKLVNTMSDPELSAPITADPESLCEKLAFCIAKQREIAASCGENAGQRRHNNMEQRAEALKAQLLENYASDRGVIRFAKDIAFGIKEMPDSLFYTKGSICNLMEAYKGDEGKTIDTPQLSGLKF